MFLVKLSYKIVTLKYKKKKTRKTSKGFDVEGGIKYNQIFKSCKEVSIGAKLMRQIKWGVFNHLPRFDFYHHYVKAVKIFS